MSNGHDAYHLLLPPSSMVTAMWDQVVKRVARRRRILETILAAARPLRVTEQRD